MVALAKSGVCRDVASANLGIQRHVIRAFAITITIAR